MDNQKLERANSLVKEIAILKENIKKVEFTQSEETEPRTAKLTFWGETEGIKVPSKLFKNIGELILSECNQELIKLLEEFESL